MNFTNTKGYGAGRLNCLLYVAAGAVKTFSIRTLPDLAHTLIISVEGGLMSISDLDVRVAEVRTLAELRSVYQYLHSGDHDVSWVVVDSASELAELCLTEAKASEKDGRAAYGVMQDAIFRTLRAFRDLPANVVFTAKMIQYQDDDQRTFYGPSFPGKALTQGVAFLFDVVLACRTQPNPETGEPQRMFQTATDGRWAAKCRAHGQPTFIPADWSALYSSAFGG